MQRKPGGRSAKFDSLKGAFLCLLYLNSNHRPRLAPPPLLSLSFSVKIASPSFCHCSLFSLRHLRSSLVFYCSLLSFCRVVTAILLVSPGPCNPVSHDCQVSQTPSRCNVRKVEGLVKMVVPIIGEVEVSLQPDGHFGLVDLLIHPQVLDEQTQYLWMVTIQRRPPSDDPRAFLWHVLTAADFQAADETAVPVVGTIANDARRRLELIHAETLEVISRSKPMFGSHSEYQWLCSALLFAYQRLDFPATFRDLIRQFACYRRVNVYLYAWLHYFNAIPTTNLYCVMPRLSLESYMGCFSTSPNVVQKLMAADIPVWFLRPTYSLGGAHIIKEFCDLTVLEVHFPVLDESISVLQAELSGRMHGVLTIGDAHLTWITCQSSSYLDLEQKVFLAVSPRGVSALSRRPARTLRPSSPTPQPVIAVPLSESDRQKFITYGHVCLSWVSQQWIKALKDVDKIRKIPDLDVTGYFIPEPWQLVHFDIPHRQKHFISNWLCVRPPWSAVLLHGGMNTIRPLKLAQWHEYLNLAGLPEGRTLGTSEPQAQTSTAPKCQGSNSTSSKCAQLLENVIVIFQNIFGTAALDVNSPAVWFNVDVATIDGEDWQKLCRQITWEISEVGFRCELAELDSKVVCSSTDPVFAGERAALIAKIFPSDRKLFLSKAFPSHPDGLNAPSYRQRAPYLDAFQQLPTSAATAQTAAGRSSLENLSPALLLSLIHKMQLENQVLCQEATKATTEQEQSANQAKAAKKNKNNAPRSDKPDSSSEKPDTVPVDNQIKKAAHIYGLMHAPWVVPASLGRPCPDINPYSPARFASQQSRADGVVAELFHVLPPELHEPFFKKCIGLQRATMVYDAKLEVWSIFEPLGPEIVKAIHNQEFYDLKIQYLLKGKVNSYRFCYPPVIFPKDHDSDMEYAFRSPVLTRIGATTTARKYGIKNTKVGFIAFVTQAARYLVSPDPKFTETGHVTGIPYFEDFQYLKELLMKSSMKKGKQGQWYQSLIAFWDQEVFGVIWGHVAINQHAPFDPVVEDFDLGCEEDWEAESGDEELNEHPAVQAGHQGVATAHKYIKIDDVGEKARMPALTWTKSRR
ncbi:hypothetical protein NM688_g5246 [Phlebia brevispora]|uniref:Uncharacterized protein n=1 Tax=Phlebia brevispora TaxID=194682 RepID=A0ACC1SYD9_9APHY|nr:hypothetical protein NM688_g5246 [Phlebia brevispora]